MVFAASSLTDAFTAVGDAYTDAHPGTDLTFSFAASSELAGQIIEGAPADVFASADRPNMDKVVSSGGVLGEPDLAVTNAMTIIVEDGNPLGIRSLADLSTPDVVVVLAAPEVPAGRYARDVLENAGVELSPRSFEKDVKSAVMKVALGEADAAIAFVTDGIAADDRVDSVAIPAEQNVRAEYPIAVLTESGAPETSREFVEFVLSDDGQAIMRRFGFRAP